VSAGGAGSATVSLKDAYGNVASSYLGTVHFTSSDSQATLPANYTFTSTDAGVHVFSITLQTAGNQAITATDTASSNLTDSQTGITVNAAATATPALRAFPAAVTAGGADLARILFQGASGTITSGSTGTGPLTSSDAQAALLADYTFSAGIAWYSWLIQPRPLAIAELGLVAPGSPLTALPATAVQGRMDVRMVVLHEMGKLASLPGGMATEPADDLMAETLAAWTRRVNALDQVFASWA
jgi:hypothetical protein